MYYISGPMRGYPEDNFPMFNQCAEELRNKGLAVENPADHFGGKRGLPRYKYLAADVLALLKCDVIVLMPGWLHSEGACLEAQIALDTHKPSFMWRPGHDLIYLSRETLESMLV